MYICIYVYIYIYMTTAHFDLSKQNTIFLGYDNVLYLTNIKR